MRNRSLHAHLREFAEAAAAHLGELLESGLEIPFEVAQSPGATSVLYRYRPLSGQFVREHFGELRAVEGFGPATLALTRIDGLSAYLRVLGVSYVPVGERDRAEAVLREFVARLWDESSVFELEERRFDRAYAELESSLYENTVVTTVLAPLLGVQLLEERCELGSGLALVRGDTCEAPPEAVWEQGQGEPNALIVLNVEATPKEPPPLTSARLVFRKLLTTLRLFKSGAAALGPSAWWRLDDGPWQSLPLAFSGRPGSSSYRLEPGERQELAELFELVRSRPLGGGPLPWALSRFEIGCGRPIALEGLSDHLLALTALLDGEEASPAGISTRLAALCAESPKRAELEQTVEQAFRLQRMLMRGDVDADYLEATGSEPPDAIALGIEEHLRAILRDMVCGYLDSDVKRIADDLLRVESGRRAEKAPPPEPATRPQKREPILSSWEDVAPTPEEPDAADPPEPEFVVRRKSRPAKPARASTRTSGKVRSRPTGEAVSEQATEETPAVTVREIRGEDDVTDWGFDDDPADYSAAV